jgi:hypothetical protein
LTWSREIFALVDLRTEKYPYDLAVDEAGEAVSEPFDGAGLALLGEANSEVLAVQVGIVNIFGIHRYWYVLRDEREEACS